MWVAFLLRNRLLHNSFLPFNIPLEPTIGPLWAGLGLGHCVPFILIRATSVCVNFFKARGNLASLKLA